MPQNVKLSGSGSLNCAGLSWKGEFEGGGFVSAACALAARPAIASANSSVRLMSTSPRGCHFSVEEPAWPAFSLYTVGNSASSASHVLQLGNSHRINRFVRSIGPLAMPNMGGPKD